MAPVDIGRCVRVDRIGGLKIAGEDVVEEEVAPEPEPLDVIPGYDEETRALYSGGLSEDTGETMAE